ncbi:DMT family transporter [Pseudonocardia sediminis]|uniref:DMT family transporter n=1 Tax=Pseudonocardia sediminis TaxID=1397368 RepID=UPI001F5F1B43|nr:DMT family transporter [Pseudonocardia sediminis]
MTASLDTRRPYVPAPSPLSPDPRAVGTLLAGAAALSWTGILVALAGTDAATASFWRCALALVVLGPLAWREARRHGRPDAGMVGWAALAGVLLGTDFLLWTRSVLDAGAGIANVVLSVQVVALPLLAWLVSGTRVPRRQLLAAPVLLAGIALAGGVLGSAGDTPAPVRGAVLGALAGLAYAGYLFLQRAGARRSAVHVFTPVAVATASAAVTTGLAGVATTGIAVSLPAPTWMWLALLAVTGQVVAWVLIGRGSAGLAPGTTAALLLVHPVLSVVLGVVVLGESPTVAQLAGSALVVATVWAATRAPLPRRRPAVAPAVG